MPTATAYRTPRAVVGLCIAELFCLGSTFSATLVGLPVVIDTLDSGLERETILSITLAAGAGAGILTSPVFGWLSDRFASRHGHRGPWILGGTAVGALLMLLTGSAATVTMLVISWVGAQAAYAAALASLYGALTDVTPVAERSRAASWFAAAATGSLILGAGTAALLPKSPHLLLTVLPAATVLVSGLVWRSLRGTARIEIQEHDDLPAAASIGFWRLWRQRLVAQCGWSVATLFGVHVLVRRTGADTDQAATLTGIVSVLGALAAVLTAVLLAGRLARRIGYRPAISAGLALILLANLWLAVSGSFPMFLIGCVLAGAGVGIFTALDLALVLRVLRPGTTGRYLGLFSAARTLPQSLVPAIAPAMLAIGNGDLVGEDRTQNYFAFYLLGAVLSLLALSMVRSLPVPDRAASSSPDSDPDADPVGAR